MIITQHSQEITRFDHNKYKIIDSFDENWHGLNDLLKSF